jgi:peptide/nickel transport system substrate-binding protein
LQLRNEYSIRTRHINTVRRYNQRRTKGNETVQNMRKSIILTACLLLVLSISPCLSVAVESAKREETLIIDKWGGRAPNFDNFNGFIPGSPGSCGVQAVYEPLFYIDQYSGRLIPWQASSFEYQDSYTKVIIHLREGVKWNDGMPFTAEDVVFTYNLYLQNPSLSGAALRIQWIESAEKIDDHTVQLTLTSSNPRWHLNADLSFSFFIGSATGSRVLAKHIWEGEDLLSFKYYPPVETGPYELVYASESKWIWDRRDDWWVTEQFNVRPAPKRIVSVHPGPVETQCMLASRHELDAITLVATGLFETTKQANPYVISWQEQLPYGGVAGGWPRNVMVNLERYPYNITEVRKAIAYMLDREAIVEIGLEGAGVPMWSVFPSTMVVPPDLETVYHRVVNELAEKYPYVKERNLQEAKSLLESVGFTMGSDNFWIMPNGQRWEATIISSTGTDSVACVPLVALHLREGGVDAVWKSSPWSVFASEMETRDYDMALRVIGSAFLDPYATTSQFASYQPDDVNVVGYKDPEYDELIEQLASTNPLDTENMEAIFSDAVEILMKNVVVIPVYNIVTQHIFDTYYWTGWATALDAWMPKTIANAAGMMPAICGYQDPGTGEWVGGIRPRTIDYTTIYFTQDVARFRATDLVWMGPFSAKDSARLPVDDAEYWISKGYASYTPPAPGLSPELSEALTNLQDAITTSNENLADQIASLNGQMTTIMVVAVVQLIAIAVLAVLFMRARE